MANMSANKITNDIVLNMVHVLANNVNHEIANDIANIFASNKIAR